VVPEPGVDAPVYEAHKGIHPEHLDAPHQYAASRSSTAAAAGTAGALAGGHAAQSYPTDTVGSASSTAGPHQSDLLNKADPRVDSDLDGSRTAGTTGTGTTTDVAPGQHELRHTGHLDDPTPRSSGLAEDHHHGRDAAIAGGIGASAAGLGYAATRDRDTPSATDSNVLHRESSPYSSTQLDPRALGSRGKIEDQQYDPQLATTHHTSPASNVAAVPSTSHQTHHDDKSEKTTTGPHKSSLLNKLDPRVKNDSKTETTTKQSEPESHHGRDAALVGTGGLGGAALARHEMQRNDTPGTGTAVLTQDTTTGSSTAPLSSTTMNRQTANTSAPLTSSTTATSQSPSTAHQQSSITGGAPLTQPSAASTSDTPFDTYHGPKTTSGTPFYGAAGAPAPVENTRSHDLSSTSSTTSPATQQHGKDHHYGRDAGLTGAGLATAGGLAYAGQRDDKTSTGPASSTIGPHTSNVANVLDPRVQPDPAKQKSHTTDGSHDTLNRVDPKVDEKSQHHYGRDAAVVGGTGAAGSGAYEAVNAYWSHPSTQPAASMNEQRYDTGATGAHAPNPVPSSAQYDYNNDSTRRNVALGTGAAVGAGALGGAAYAGTRHADNTQLPATSSQPLSAQPAPVTQSYPTQGTLGHQTHDPSTATYPSQGVIAPQNTYNTAPGTTQRPYDATHDPRDTDHHKRDAALLGTGATVAGGAGYVAHSQNQDVDRMEHERQERLKKEQHAHDKEQKKLDKEAHKHEKEAHKHEKEAHKHEKEAHKHEKEAHKHEKEAHKHDKALAADHKHDEKEAHRLEKEREKEAKRLDKDAETPEKKHGILGFLHRDKSKREDDTSPRHSGEVRRSVDAKRYSREYDDDSSTNPDSPRWKGKNKLHKDPPKGHPAREALEQHELGEMSGGNGSRDGVLGGGKQDYRGVDAPVGSSNVTSGYQ
jgi:flagellar biosynthesis GTPase FlhF